MTKVSLVGAEYTNSSLHNAVAKSFKILEPLPDLNNKKVFLKVNLLMSKKPEEAVTTHPFLVEKIAEFFIKKGAHVIIGDSPGGPFLESYLKKIYQVTGMEEVAKRLNCELNFDTSQIDVSCPNGKRIKKVTLVKAMVETDYLVSIGKLKTHGMTTYTGVVKNMYGAVPGLIKAQYHFNAPEINEFTQLIIDVCEAIKPDLAFLDGIVGMEGNGPSGGEPRKIGVLLAGYNPYAVDIIGAQLINLDSEKVPMLKNMEERKLTTDSNNDSIEVLGEDIADYKIMDFKMPKTKSIQFLREGTPTWLRNFLEKQIKAYPGFNNVKCNGCGICARSCPAKIIEMVFDKKTNINKPKVNLKECICCFCCHELCPQNAVDIKHRLLGRLFLK